MAGPTAPTNPTTPPGTPAATSGGNTTYRSNTATDGQPSKYSKSDTSAQYQVGETVTNVVKAPGEAKQVSVSVLLDADKVSKDQEETIRGQVENLVKAETDVAASNVKVDRFKFDTSGLVKEKAEQDAAAYTERTNRILGYAVPFGLMLIMLRSWPAASPARAAEWQAGAGGLGRYGGIGGVGGIGGMAGMGGMGGMQPALAGAGYAGGYAGGGSLNMMVGDDGVLIPGMNVEDAIDAEGRSSRSARASRSIRTK